MKVLLIHVYFSKQTNSGVNPIVFNTYDKLRECGNDVYIFSLDIAPYYDEQYRYTDFFVTSNYVDKTQRSIHKYVQYYLNTLYNCESRCKLNKLLNEINPDLVHIHTTWELSFSILEPIKKRKIPIIYTAHDIGICCPAAFFIGENFCNKCNGYNTFPCIQNKCIKGNMLQSTFFSIKSFVERLLGAHKLNYYLTVSQATKNYMIKMGIKEYKIEVLPNFISNSLVKKAIPNYSKENSYFLYAGGGTIVKGINTLLEVMLTLPREIELHLLGAGYTKEQEDYIKNNNLTNVKIIGLLTKEQIQEEYKNCISVIMPSECFETFGMINIEAAIYSKPSISSNIGGLPDVVENNKTGLIFEPTNVEELKDCILRYWNNRELAIEHGKNARNKALINYNEDKYFSKLIQIYEEVIKNAR